MSISDSDHIAIQRLMYRYARCADHKDYEGFAAVFCEDAVFDFLGERVTPCTAIQEMMRTLEKYTSTMHQVHNTLYEVEEDFASGETYCLATHLLSADSTVTKIDMGIVYRDQLRRTSNGWLIAYREFNLLWSHTAVVDGS
jgi:ketosteroid isomerase-like protein|tara:strand:- start:3688 stop:4110 length:423 start_codon:yes stop_codon:yes gene_type:complete